MLRPLVSMGSMGLYKGSFPPKEGRRVLSPSSTNSLGRLGFIGLRVSGLGFRAEGLGFRVSGFGLRVLFRF